MIQRTLPLDRLLRVAALLLLVFPWALSAQTSATGALTGTVTDASGGVVPNATVTITSESGQVQTTATAADGTYKFVLLPPGNFQVKFEAAGFETVVIPSATIYVTETEVLNRSLSVGSQTQQIFVKNNVETVQTATSTLGTVISSQTMVDLPLSTRNFTNLLGYSAGANSNVNNAMLLGEGADQIAVNGAATTQNNFLEDGVAWWTWPDRMISAITSAKFRFPIPIRSRNSRSRRPVTTRAMAATPAQT